MVTCILGCSSPPPIIIDRRMIKTRKPVDRTGDILNVKDIPKWIIDSYIEWVRYGYVR